jgi:low affinity Fe/Cu permease
MQDLYRKLERKFEKLTSIVLSILGSSIAFVIALVIVIFWLTQKEFYTQSLHECISDVFLAITFLAFFMIQKWFNHFSASLHLKLNELVSAHDNANNAVINIENKTEEEIREIAKDYAEIVEEILEEVEQIQEEKDQEIL